MTTRKITQIFNINIDTVRTLNEIVTDKDGDGILSAGDIVNGAAVYKDDFTSTDSLGEFLSQATHRRVEILSTQNGMHHYLAYSNVGAPSELAGVFRIAKWGYCTGWNGYDHECVSDDAKYDPNYDHSDPYRDLTIDRLIYAASQFTNQTEDGKRISDLWRAHRLTGDALLYPTEFDFNQAQWHKQVQEQNAKPKFQGGCP